jgi:hypothetical protein
LAREQYLFLSTPIPVRMQQQQRSAFDQIESLTSNVILSKTVDEWVNELTAKYRIEVPTIDRNNCYTMDHEGQIPIYQLPNPNFGDTSPMVPGKFYTFHIPYVGEESMFYDKPTFFQLDNQSARTTDTEVIFTFAGASLTTKDIDDKSDAAIKFVENCLGKLKNDVKNFNEQLPHLLRPKIDARRQAAEKDTATAAGLKYAIRRRPNAPDTYKVPAIKRKISIPPAPSKTPGADPALDEDHYRHILNVIEGMTAVMERSPAAFEEMGEEHIRFHYLLQLNAQYDGMALGEAFNFAGKTDILVRYNNQNLFIAECKFWDGQKTLTGAVDQLFNYTTWRDTKTAIIVFVKRTQFTAVVAEAQNTMNAHPQYVSGPVKEGQTRFRYVFKLANDPDRHITITLMLFNIPKLP